MSSLTTTQDSPPADLRAKVWALQLQAPHQLDTRDLVQEISRTLPFLTNSGARDLAGRVFPFVEREVGLILTSGLSAPMLAELDRFMTPDFAWVEAWLAANLPGFRDGAQFRELVDARPDASMHDAVLEFGALQWLTRVRPDHQDVVRGVLDELLGTLETWGRRFGPSAFASWLLVETALAGLGREHTPQSEETAGAGARP